MAVTTTYGTLARRGAFWVMDDVAPHVSIRLKQLFPRIRKTDPPPYVFPDAPDVAADLDWFTRRYPLAASISDLMALRARRVQFENNQAEIERLFSPHYTPPLLSGLRSGQVLRPYQAQLVDMVRLSRRVLCGDEVGLGKTYEAAGMFLLPGALPAVAVCYPHLQRQWKEKIEGFTTLKCHLVRTLKPYGLPGDADVYIFRWSQMRGWADVWQVLRPKSVAFDEVQELRTGLQSDRAASAKRLIDDADPITLGLTATPIYNWGIEIWNIMNILRPGLLGSQQEFEREWSPDGHVTDPKALGTYLREQHAFVRRTRKDVGQELPAVSRIVESIGYDEHEMHSVDALAHALAIRATTAEFTERGKAVRELDMRVRQATGVAKAKTVAAFVRLIVETGERVIVYGWHREVYDIWLEELKDLEPCMYTGSESPAAKDREKQRFIEGKPKPLFISLRAGAGLDGLQNHCSILVFGELDWSPGVHHQCIGRLDREGQENPVSAIFLVTDEGSDPPMMEQLGLKASEASQIIDPHLGVTVVNTDDSRLQALVQKYLTSPSKKPRQLAGLAPQEPTP
ncbi:MAG TPA: DEAD/DEAH box helicase [Rhizomicrobium sp.]|jgi:superfamily II DNA or RNA helicase|nr:DEAD/DEAH box helicase [Rhizomicrobium sp.]